MGMTASDDDLLTPEAVAEQLGVAVSTLIRWRRETRRHRKQIGPVWVELTAITVRYTRGAVREFIRSREQRVDG